MRGLKGLVWQFKQHKYLIWGEVIRLLLIIWFFKNSQTVYLGWLFLIMTVFQNVNHWAGYQYSGYGDWKEKYGNDPPWDPALK